MEDRPCTYRQLLGLRFILAHYRRNQSKQPWGLDSEGIEEGGGGGEFVLKFAWPDTDLAVFFVFFFCGLLSFLVCYRVRQQSQSILCGSVLTTMTPKTENTTAKTTNTLHCIWKRLVQAQCWQSWQSKSRRSVRSATAKTKNNLGPQGGFVRTPWTPPPTGLVFPQDVISWCTL